MVDNLFQFSLTNIGGLLSVLLKARFFSMYCRFAHKHKLLCFTKRGEEAFTVVGFDNYKKVLEKFRIHDTCDSHQEAKLKQASLNNPTIRE